MGRLPATVVRYRPLCGRPSPARRARRLGVYRHLVAAVLGVIAAEEGAADAAGDAVEAAGGAVVDEVFAGLRHGGTELGSNGPISRDVCSFGIGRGEGASDACPRMTSVGVLN